MVFAKIKKDICVNIMEFSTKEEAELFDKELVELEEDYGIGDLYRDGKWFKSVETVEEQIEKIKKMLSSLDTIIDRATEDIYTEVKITPYEKTQNVINRKRELRNELKTLIEGE